MYLTHTRSIGLCLSAALVLIAVVFLSVYRVDTATANHTRECKTNAILEREDDRIDAYEEYMNTLLQARVTRRANYDKAWSRSDNDDREDDYKDAKKDYKKRKSNAKSRYKKDLKKVLSDYKKNKSKC